MVHVPAGYVLDDLNAEGCKSIRDIAQPIRPDEYRIQRLLPELMLCG
jgi:hypothetical protein